MCKHEGRCVYCVYHDLNIKKEPCNICGYTGGNSKFECAICKKEKATGEMAKSK